MQASPITCGALSVFLITAAHGASTVRLTRAEYEDRVEAVWASQIIAVLLAWPHEHQVSSSIWLTHFPKPYKAAPVDDDWYYEMCAVRAFERHGIGLTVQQLGQQWEEVKVDLSEFAGKTVTLRLYQRVLLPNKTAGNAYWKALELN